MDQIETVSQGWWRPSPGSVYPLLENLLKEGSIKKREDGKYEITEKGTQESYWPPWGPYIKQPRAPEEIIAEIESYISYLEDTKKSDESKITKFTERLQIIKDRLTKLIE